jgi:four helix bundle protein
MPHTRSFVDLEVWQRAMDLMVACYELTHRLPRDERFGLCSQLQRASLSVASNVAEGNGRRTRGEYLNHLSIAQGSLNEVHTLLIAAVRLGYVTRGELKLHAALLVRVGQMLTRLRQSLADPRA